MVADSMENWPVIEEPTEAEVDRVRRYAVALGGAASNNPHSNRSRIFQSRKLLNTPKRVELAACDRIAEFTVPMGHEPWMELVASRANPDYDRRPTELQARADGTRMCVVDDGAHLWPRFR